MPSFDAKNYTEQLVHHYENYFGLTGTRLKWPKGPVDKLHPDFFILEFPPNQKQEMFCYCTVGMSVDYMDEPMEMIVYSPRSDLSLVELLTICTSYHRNKAPLNLHHTVNIGQPWLDFSRCDHGFISLPYLDGNDLCVFNFNDQVIPCYWFIPITKQERDYKIEQGAEALELLFEQHQLDYLNAGRESLIPYH
ncbi:suppressor of fused domain protein [Pedobacter steynii]|uniref:Suppressor of fused-like domain-containing protein n=1 Tax=Pedobacter steynii TaxID=430522 RepID=A0A1D7QG83_9SPHI|nr:suppressor of fused domain protein [Pedobacter steynii]AOM77702.1 hypothetical protein BFS30_11285 [Pedobacter steynii]